MKIVIVTTVLSAYKMGIAILVAILIGSLGQNHESNQVTNNLVIVSTNAKGQAATILVGILVVFIR